MTKILMSACMLGQKIRYDGGDSLQHHTRLQDHDQKGLQAILNF